MGFNERLEEMLESVGYSGNSDDTFNYKNKASSLNGFYDNEYFDPFLQKLFDRELEFSERDEGRIRFVTNEMVTNESYACDNREDLYVEVNLYLGNMGVVLRVNGDGPGFDYVAEIEKRKTELDEFGGDDVASGMWERRSVALEKRGAKGGHGIYALLKFTDDFQYNINGNGVVARFDFGKEE